MTNQAILARKWFGLSIGFSSDLGPVSVESKKKRGRPGDSDALIQAGTGTTARLSGRIYRFEEPAFGRAVLRGAGTARPPRPSASKYITPITD
jgi:hypothetical protein